MKTYALPGSPQAKADAFAGFTLQGGLIRDVATRIARWIGFGGALSLTAGFSLFLWLVLAVLSAVEGDSDRFFSLGGLAIHVRLLVAIPMILLCEKILDRAIRDAVGALLSSAIVADDSRIALDSDADMLVRINSSWLLDLGLLIAVLVFGATTPHAYLPGVSSSAADSAVPTWSFAAQWYWLVCLPIFRFMMARFLWLLGLWTFLIWRISRQPLNLAASHPDRAGGLGLLEVAQEQLTLFVLVLAVIDSAGLAETFQHVEPNELQVYAHVLLVIVIGVVAVCGPPMLLVPALFRCRRAGMVEFAMLAHEYSVRFRRRWIGPLKPSYDDLLGVGDIQSLADLRNAYDTVRSMRILPVTRTLFLLIFGCAVAPHLPLLLLKYPIAHVMLDFVQTITGN
jgi:hypothetical protein